MRLRAAESLWHWYEGCLKRRPWVANALSGATIITCSDSCTQLIERRYFAPRPPADQDGPDNGEPRAPVRSYRSAEYEPRRTVILAGIVMLQTPLWCSIYKFTDYVISGQAKTIGRAVRQGFMTWCIGSTLNPAFVTAVTVSSAAWIHGVREPAQLYACVEERLQRNFFTHIGAAFVFWSPQWIVLFYYMPAHLRLLWASCMQVLWNGALSFIQHRD